MKKTKRFLGLIAAALLATSAWAQMTFTYADGIAATASEMADGSVLVRLPLGTDLNDGLITGVKINGVSVDATKIIPNPTTTFITEEEIETFVYDGKAYSFRFTLGGYFTAVMFSDPHVAQTNYSGTSVENMQSFVSEILRLGKGGKTVTFAEAPADYVPTADIVFCMGDMDKDSESEGNNFRNAMKGFNDAGVPFITIAGNHDLRPDYWHDSDNSPALTAFSMSDYIFALDLVKEQYTKAAEYGKFIVDTIADARTELTSPGHFSFMFRGVRFYCANNYWFQKPYYVPPYPSVDLENTTLEELEEILASYVLTPYAADGVIDALNSYVEAHADEASVWISHFPFYSEANDWNDAYERWWLDQNNAPHAVCYKPVDAATSKFYNGDNELPKYTTPEGQAIVAKKQKALADIIVKTKNPRHFSGHSHRDDGADVTATNGKTFRDHTIQPAFNRWAFVVLCKEGKGVVEVQRVRF